MEKIQANNSEEKSLKPSIWLRENMVQKNREYNLSSWIEKRNHHYPSRSIGSVDWKGWVFLLLHFLSNQKEILSVEDKEKAQKPNSQHSKTIKFPESNQSKRRRIIGSNPWLSMQLSNFSHSPPGSHSFSRINT